MKFSNGNGIPLLGLKNWIKFPVSPRPRVTGGGRIENGEDDSV